MNQQPLLGLEKVVIPTEDSPKEVWDDYYKKIGRPDKPDDYQTPQDGLPEGVDIDASAVNAFFGEAHRMGLSKNQAAAMVRWQLEQTKTAIDTQTRQREEAGAAAEATLKKEFGEGYAERLDMGKTLLRKFGGQGLLDKLDASGLGNDPDMIGAWMKIAGEYTQDEIKGKGGRSPLARSRTEAVAALEVFEGTEDYQSYLKGKDSNSPKVKAAKRTYDELMGQAFPTEDAEVL